jgi:ribosomal protein S18 acetylase RimI-like enzyme
MLLHDQTADMRRPLSLEIRPITDDDLGAVLDVYRQCEDFLALGPEPTASMEMVLRDVETSQREGGRFCGIFAVDSSMVGVVDYVAGNYEGDPHSAFLSLLMIAAPYRRQGIGQAVVALIEDEIRRDPQITAILSGVQVNNPQAVHFWQKNDYRIVGGPELQEDGTMTFQLRKGTS